MDDIVSRINNHLIKKVHLTVEDGLPITGDTGPLFDACEALHPPAQVASAVYRIAFGPAAGRPVRRLRSSLVLWHLRMKHLFRTEFAYYGVGEGGLSIVEGMVLY